MDEAITFLQELVQIDTSTSKGKEGCIANILKRKFEAAGITVKLIPYADQRINLVAEFGDGDTIFAFTGHEDVVNPGNLDAWKFPPFSAHIDGDKLYGRGASDMKSGLAAMALAFIELKQSGFNGHLRFLATVGEEYGAAGARQLTELGYADDLTALLVGEPSGGDLIFGHAGSYNYQVVSHGKSVHSSIPETGINAITKLINFAVAEQSAFNDLPKDPVIGPLVHSITILNAGEQINTIPDIALLAGNIRPTPSFTNEQVTQRLNDIIAKINAKEPGKLEFQLIHSFYPVLTDKYGSLVTSAKKAIETVSKKEPALTIMHGATDASEFTKSKNKFETIIYGPGNEAENVSHQINEYVSLIRYQQVINEYRAIVRHYFNQ